MSMIARELISDTIPSVKTSDKVGRVLEWMGEFKVNQLPVVNHEQLLGLVTEEDLLDSESEDQPIGAVRLSLPETTCVFEDDHLYEVLKYASSLNLDALPVLRARDNTYLGVITKTDLVEESGRVLNVNEPGGIIVLNIPVRSYSLSEIGRICESNEAKVLSLTVNNSPDPTHLFVTLKLNIRELSRVIATFERFDYDISLVIFDAEQLDDYREKYENLLRYLDF